MNACSSDTLREKCPNTDFFLVRDFLYSVRIQGNTEQKKLRIWTFFTQWQEGQCYNYEGVLRNFGFKYSHTPSIPPQLHSPILLLVTISILKLKTQHFNNSFFKLFYSFLFVFEKHLGSMDVFSNLNSTLKKRFQHSKCYCFLSKSFYRKKVIPLIEVSEVKLLFSPSRIWSKFLYGT